MNYCKWGLIILAAFTFAACGGNSPNPDSNPNPGTNPDPRGKVIGVPTVIAQRTVIQINAKAATAAAPGLQPLQFFIGPARCDVTVVQINYQTPGAQAAEMSNASAAVLIPGGANCPGPFPLIAYARGTEFEKNRTVANPDDDETFALMAFYAAQGYAVVATDYLGYALSSYPYHPYLHAETEASAVIDSIRATRQAAASLNLTLNGKVMVTGYSQGGHAAMAAQRAIERDHAGEINLVAAAHLAGPYRVSAAMVAAVSNPVLGVQAFAPFQITSWQKVYKNVYSTVTSVFKLPYANYIEGLLPTTLTRTQLFALLPIGTPTEAMTALFTPVFLADLAANPANGTRVAAAKQDLLGWNPQAPTTLCGGAGDPTVRFSINATPTAQDFNSRVAGAVSIVDVDAKIQLNYATLHATSFATYNDLYHATLEPPFCFVEAKNLFDLHK
jgi:pimeloyl-ACP methyl ester carboxylesterase